MKLAVIEAGGKQYIVKAGNKIKIEKLPQKVEESVNFDKVFLMADDETGALEIGKPFLSNVKVSARVLEQGRSKKVSVVKYKPKIRYRKKYGHRQPYTKVEISEITG